MGGREKRKGKVREREKEKDLLLRTGSCSGRASKNKLSGRPAVQNFSWN